MQDAIRAETVTIAGHGGDEIEAYLAQPLGDDGPFGGVVVIHHMPGYDEATKEIARRFAHHRYLALVPNLYYRIAPGASPDDAAAAARAAGGVSDEQLVGDVEGAARHLRSLGTAGAAGEGSPASNGPASNGPASNGKVATIGYCSGGRQSFLAACSLPLDAAVDCYGAFVVRPVPEGVPLEVSPIVDLTPNLSCPLLGLFGGEDSHPSPEEVGELEQALQAAGKDFEFHIYDGAGHAFFAVDRPSYRPEAAKDGWARIFDFFGRHLATPAARS